METPKSCFSDMGHFGTYMYTRATLGSRPYGTEVGFKTQSRPVLIQHYCKCELKKEQKVVMEKMEEEEEEEEEKEKGKLNEENKN